jgi:hypothetical protein
VSGRLSAVGCQVKAGTAVVLVGSTVSTFSVCVLQPLVWPALSSTR